MPAYVILTREETRSEAKWNEYRRLVPASIQKHPGKFRAIHGRHDERSPGRLSSDFSAA
jgi:uncharacterized protein (DUF1330 family)